MNRKKALSTAILTLVSLAFLFLAFRRIEFAELARSFRTIEWVWTIPFTILTYVGYWWRAWRWRVLLEPAKRLTIADCFGPMMVGFGFNSIFPARAGEFARPLALTKASGVPFTTGFSTVFLERVLDALTLLGLFALAPLFIDFGKTVSMSYDATSHMKGGTLVAIVWIGVIAVPLGIAFSGWVASRKLGKAGPLKGGLIAAAFLLGVGVVAGMFVAIDPSRVYTFGQKVELTPETLPELVKGLSRFVGLLFLGSVLMLFQKFRDFVLAVILRVPLVPAGLKEKVAGLFRTFAEGFDSLRDPRRAVEIVAHSIGIWFLTGFTFQLMSWGVPGVEMSLTTGMAFLVITCIAILIPAAPGYWGLYEVGGVLALILVGAVPNTTAGQATALSYTLVVHAIQWLVPTVIGLWYAARIHVSTADVERERAA